MANTDEALDLKRRARRRLIGAIALVLFLVIVPPWVMDLEPKPVETSLQVEIPKPDERPLPLPAPATAGNEQPAQPAQTVTEAPVAEAAPPADPPPAPEPAAPAEPVSQPAAKQNVEPPAKAPDAKAETKRTGEYIIPVATLSTKSGVKDLQAKIARVGIKTYTEPVKTSAGVQTRVRAGPFATKDAAEKARQRLRGLGLKPGNVTTR